MRIYSTIVFITTVLLSAIAGETSAQHVTLHAKDTPLSEVLATISKQTGYNFVMKNNLLDAQQRVSLSVKEAPLKEVVAAILADKPLGYEIQDDIKVVVIKEKGRKDPKDGISEAESNRIQTPITGRVTDTTGRSLEGATVRVGGTKDAPGTATLTDSGGRFILYNVAPGTKVTVSYMGFITQELPAAVNMAVILQPSTSDLEEVAVTFQTGYQQLNAERFVGSVAVLDSAAFHRRTGMGILERLDGTVPGLLMDKRGAGTQIRGLSTIRGLNSASSEPLIIVDNFPFPGTLSDINANDVEQISVLKDAAAASIWGTRAGNGVIVITTKKGRANQPLQLSFKSNMQVTEKPDLFYVPKMPVSDVIDVEVDLFSRGFYDANLNDNMNWPVISPVVEILSRLRDGQMSQGEADAAINGFRTQDLRNDLDRYVNRQQLQQQQHLSMHGGNQALTYALSLGYNRTAPDVQGGKASNQFTLLSNTVFRPVKGLALDLGLNLNKDRQHGKGISLPEIYPYARLADENGNPMAIPMHRRLSYAETAGDGKLLDWLYRPLDEIRLRDDYANSLFVRVNFGVSYQATDWLHAEVRYQYLQGSSETRNLQSQETYTTRNTINLFTQINGNNVTRIIPLGGILDIANNSLYSHNVRGQLNVSKNWGANHRFTAMLAGDLSESKAGDASANRFYGYNEQNFTYASAFNYLQFYPQYGHPWNTGRIPNGDALRDGTLNRLVSIVANANYVFSEKYTAYASARRDGANVFGVNTNSRWKPLWSAGLGWDVNKESFYNISWLPVLKLSASYGYTGNINNSLSGLPTIEYASSVNQYTNMRYANVGQAPNPNLRWEEVRLFNTGLVFQAFGDRLSGNVEVYTKHSNDIISNLPFDPTSGVNLYTVNAASLKGNGLDLMINSMNTAGPVIWNTGLGFSHARTIVTRVYQGVFRTSDFFDYNMHSSEGKPAYGLASYRWAGLDPATGDPRGYLQGQISNDYLALANDSVGNQVFHGSAIPLYHGFINNSILWRGITFSANITGKLNYFYRKPTISYGPLFSGWSGHPDYALRWQKAGDERNTTVPSMVYPADPSRDVFYAFSELHVLRGDHIRIQDLSLRYSLGKGQLWKMPFHSINLGFYANNLNVIVWRRDKSNLDPEYSGGTQADAFPAPRTWTVELGVNF